MAKQSKTRHTSVGQEKLYLLKAKRFLDGAQVMIGEENWEAAASLGIHAIISSCDSLTAKFLKQRHSGADHKGLLDLLSMLPFADKKELKDTKRRVAEAITAKTNVEYDDKPVRPTTAKHIVSEAGRVFCWAKEHVE